MIQFLFPQTLVTESLKAIIQTECFFNENTILTRNSDISSTKIMQVQIIIGAYFLVIILIGIISFFKIKTPTDYYVAGKNAGVIPVSGSLLATILGGSAVLGTIELGQQIGWAGFWLLFSAAAGLMFLIPLSKYVKRFGNFTLPELLGKFYGKNAETIASVIIPVAWLGIVAAQIIASAKILDGLNLLSYNSAALISGLVFITYTLKFTYI